MEAVPDGKGGWTEQDIAAGGVTLEKDGTWTSFTGPDYLSRTKHVVLWLRINPGAGQAKLAWCHVKAFSG